MNNPLKYNRDAHMQDDGGPNLTRRRPLQAGEAFVGLTLLSLAVYSIAIVAAITQATGVSAGTGSSLSDWLSAIGALGALLAASWAAWAAWSTLTVERQRDAVLENERRKAHASTVAVWASDVTDRLLTSVSGKPELDVVTIQLRNASPLPVTEVKVAILFRVAPDVLRPFGDLRTIPVLPPSEGVPIEVKVQTLVSICLDDFDDLHSTPLNRVVIRLRFKDASGVEWRRDTPGGLRLRHRGHEPTFWCRHEFARETQNFTLVRISPASR